MNDAEPGHDPTCPATTHNSYSSYRAGCRSTAARADMRRYYREYRQIANRIGNHGPALIPAWKVARRLQALAALGWDNAALAEHYGCHHSMLTWLRRTDHAHVTAQTFQRVDDLYEKLSGTPGPSQVARRRARRRGWVPPLAWDRIDDPDEEPCLRKHAA